MKNIVATLFVVFLLMGFNNSSEKTKYPESLSLEVIEKFESEYIKTMDNEALKTYLQKNFIRYFDEIESISAQYSDVFGYYYLVIGTKSNHSSLELLKIEKEDIENESYTYIDFSGLDINEDTEYCRKSVPENLPCAACDRYPDGTCFGVTCGIWNGIQCVQT